MFGDADKIARAARLPLDSITAVAASPLHPTDEAERDLKALPLSQPPHAAPRQPVRFRCGDPP